jgi:hypothetical protein
MGRRRREGSGGGRRSTQITKELKITPILEKLLEYKRNWIQHLNRMPRTDNKG